MNVINEFDKNVVKTRPKNTPKIDFFLNLRAPKRGEKGRFLMKNVSF
jgi:hypothetical protein